MSDTTGTPRFSLTACRMRRPSLSPGPRKEAMELRFALSKDDLKMYGTPTRRAASDRAAAIFKACSSLSITQGPAMKASGEPPPIARSPVIATRRVRPRPGSALGLTVPLAGTDEAPEERMREHRLRLELGVELAGQEIRMLRDFDDFHEASVRGLSADPETAPRH